jgi:hypothetical protein
MRDDDSVNDASYVLPSTVKKIQFDLSPEKDGEHVSFVCI